MIHTMQCTYSTLVPNPLLYGCENWVLTAPLCQRLNTFQHNAATPTRDRVRALGAKRASGQAQS
jgi:hypothetical protein